MEDELQKIDIIRERFPVGYEEARNALRASDGDVIEALTIVERDRGNFVDLLAVGTDVAGELKKLADGGPIKKVRFKYGDRLMGETPVALTAIAAIAVVVAAAIVSKLVIELEKGEEAVT
jgi:hypothetical protein